MICISPSDRYATRYSWLSFVQRKRRTKRVLGSLKSSWAPITLLFSLGDASAVRFVSYLHKWSHNRSWITSRRLLTHCQPTSGFPHETPYGSHLTSDLMQSTMCICSAMWIVSYFHTGALTYFQTETRSTSFYATQISFRTSYFQTARKITLSQKSC